MLLLLLACTLDDLLPAKEGVDDASFCSDVEPLRSGFEAELEPHGCGYEIMAAGDFDDVRILLDVPAFDVVLADGTVSATYTLPDAHVQFSVEVGCDLNETWCTDVYVGTAVVNATYSATAGTVTVDGTRDEDSDDSDVTVTFTDVVLEDSGGNSVTIDALTWTDVWLYTAQFG